MRRAEQIVLVVAVAACLAAGAGCASTSQVRPQTRTSLEATATTQVAATTDPSQGSASGSTSSTPAAPPNTSSRPETPKGGAEKRVRIGINGDVPGTKLHELVKRQVVAAGGVPIRMRPGNLDVQSVDGIILIGGADIHPWRYDERAHPKTSVVSPEREKYDLALAKAALDGGVPILGICLGAQEIWVARGGSLVQDIPTEVGTKVDHRARDRGQRVSLVDGSTLAGIYGAQKLRVYSNHHQSVDAVKVPEGLRVGAKSSDGVIEGFESTTPTNFVIGVNWHPEREDGTALFGALVSAARANKAP